MQTIRQYDIAGAGVVYKTDRGWIARLYGDRRFWGPFTTKREAAAEVRIQAL
jgi:hypothetical protein